ncbi:hypothetical protein EVG20_g4305 [Dentipellis fragilis]|uniref:Uncharacterized protein n=1 Tax=Dentipellis fragilis TaxID=205917 RepID=A0A4Y9YX21_9AGAM|nr:hypothetical protein EVG20_g4305 [Dentipellis fragilis]
MCKPELFWRPQIIMHNTVLLGISQIPIRESITSASIGHYKSSFIILCSLVIHLPDNMPLALDRAILGAIFVECVMYGTCLTMTVATTLVLLRAKSEGTPTHKALFVTLFFMLTLATAHVILSFVRVFRGFILLRDVTDGPSAYFGELSSPVLIAKDAVYLVQTLLGDGFYIWRCYVVWGKNKNIIIAPSITMIAGIVCACMIEDTLAHALGNVFEAPNRWVKAYFFLMLVTTIYCNVAIIWRIWTTERTKRSSTLIVVLEAGILYTSILVMFLVVYMVKSNGQYIVLDSITPLVPILFCLIVLQIKYHNTTGPGLYEYTENSKIGRTATSKTFPCPRKRECRAAVAAALSNLEAQQPVEINISRSTEHYIESTRGEALKVRKEFPDIHDSSDSNSEPVPYLCRQHLQEIPPRLSVHNLCIHFNLVCRSRHHWLACYDVPQTQLEQKWNIRDMQCTAAVPEIVLFRERDVRPSHYASFLLQLLPPRRCQAAFEVYFRENPKISRPALIIGWICFKFDRSDSGDDKAVVDMGVEESVCDAVRHAVGMAMRGLNLLGKKKMGDRLARDLQIKPGEYE